MTKTSERFEGVRGFVLHTYPYSETSLIVETFTRAYGRVPLLARGAKRPGSALRGALLQFQPVEFSWGGRGDLKTLKDAEWQGGIPTLPPQTLMCGFYLNELVLKLVARDDPHESLFDAYEAALTALGAGEAEEPVLRGFEKALLSETGYALNLTSDAAKGQPIDPARRYAYDPGRGALPLEDNENGDLEVSGAALIALREGHFDDPRTAAQAKRLMRSLIQTQLDGRMPMSRRIFTDLTPS